MRIMIMYFILIVTFVLQTTVFENFKIYNIFPNVPLIIIVCYSLLRGRKEGVLLCIFLGLLFDTFFGWSYGFYSIPIIAIGFVIGGFNKNFYKENYLLPIFFNIVSLTFYETFFFLKEFFMRGFIDIFHYGFHILLVNSLYVGVLTIPIYRLLYSLDVYFKMKDRYKYRF